MLKFHGSNREGQAIGGMRGYEVLAKRMRVVDHNDRGAVEVGVWG